MIEPEYIDRQNSKESRILENIQFAGWLVWAVIKVIFQLIGECFTRRDYDEDFFNENLL